MRSPRAAAAAATVLLSVVGGIVAGATMGDAASALVIHFGIGAGFVLLATAAFDFRMPRWASWIGALSAGAFGAIFLLQGVSNLLPGATLLSQIAFDTLGHEIERVLPDIVYVWFVALLLFASTGRTRIIGWLVMGTVIGVEVASLVATVAGVGFPTIKILLFAPFIWLLLEAVKKEQASAQAIASEATAEAVAG
jgi:hypothetical protein